MKLYYAPGACSLAPHIVACEAGLPLDTEKVDLSKHTTASGKDFKAINPKGYVPALILNNGELFTEASVIVQYLADQASDKKLIPAAGTFERYRVQEWLNFISAELHKGFGPFFNPAIPDTVKNMALDRLKLRFAHLDKHLANHAYLMGDTFTVADAYGFTVLNWTNMLKIDLSAYPNLQAYMKRVSERPKVRQAMADEGLLQAA